MFSLLSFYFVALTDAVSRSPSIPGSITASKKSTSRLLAVTTRPRILMRSFYQSLQDAIRNRQNYWLAGNTGQSKISNTTKMPSTNISTHPDSPKKSGLALARNSLAIFSVNFPLRNKSATTRPRSMNTLLLGRVSRRSMLRCLPLSRELQFRSP